MALHSNFVPLYYISCHLFAFSGTSDAVKAMSTSTEVSAFNLGPQGRVVLPIAVRRAANLTEGAAMVARAEGEGRIVIEIREAITKRVWANAPTPTGLNTISDVRQMRSEDNETSEVNFTRRSRAASQESTEAAGVLLLKRLGR